MTLFNPSLWPRHKKWFYVAGPILGAVTAWAFGPIAANFAVFAAGAAVLWRTNSVGAALVTTVLGLASARFVLLSSSYAIDTTEWVGAAIAAVLVVGPLIVFGWEQKAMRNARERRVHNSLSRRSPTLECRSLESSDIRFVRFSLPCSNR